MKTLSRFLAAFAFAVLAFPAFASPVSLLSGPQDPSQLQAQINSLIVSMNSVYANAGAGTTSSALTIPSVASAVNLIQLTPSATGTAPSVSIGGGSADANRNLGISGAGTGIVILGQAICTITGSTPQTCNGQRGIVTTGTLTTAAATDASFVINNSSVGSSSLIECTDQGYSGTLVTNGYPVLETCVPGSGTITVHITNLHASNALNGTVQIGFAVLN